MAGTFTRIRNAAKRGLQCVSITALFAALAGGLPAHAELHGDITKGVTESINVALPFLVGQDGNSAAIGQQIMETAERDLVASGFFNVPSRAAYLQQFKSYSDLPVFDSWRAINSDATVAGEIAATGNSITVSYRLWDVVTEKQLLGKQFTTDAANRRRLGHIIADQIYQALTGEPGYFDSRIAYVAETIEGSKRTKRIAVMDQDGFDHRYLTSGGDLVLTPRLSPDGSKLMYVSYSGGKPGVFFMDMNGGGRVAMGSFGGMAFSPAFAPNGSSGLVSVSRGGNTDIFAISVPGGGARPLTGGNSIETSPSYSPDGSRIVYSSDRSGKAQLYVTGAGGGDGNRISFGDGDYNTPSWSPMGDLIAFTKRSDGRFHIGVMAPDGSGERLLTTSYMDEGPSWSPNGRMLVFARQNPSSRGRPGESYLYRVDVTGSRLERINTPGQGSDPSWAGAGN